VPPLELALVLLSGLLHASWNAATKGSTTPVGFMLAMEVVALGLFVPVLVVGFDPLEVPTTVWGLVLVSSVVHSLYSWWLTSAYAHGELSLVYPIVRSTPALVPLVAVPLLGESVSLPGALGIALVVLSLWAITGEGGVSLAALRSRGAVLAFMTLLTTVVYSLVDKEAMRLLDESPWSGGVPRSVAFMALMYVLYLPGFCFLARRSVPVREVWQLLRCRFVTVVGASVFGFLSYTLILRAMQTAPVSYITAVRQSSVLFALVIAIVLLRERPSRLRVLGALANVGGVALIALSA
jgi:drug/metabolite transporter (DMT)-like permease